MNAIAPQNATAVTIAPPLGWCSIDFETRSDVDLTKTGVYRYIESANTDAWCLAYGFDSEPVQLWEKGEPFPQRVADHIKSGGKFRAWSAQFEYVIWNYVMARRYGWPRLPREQLYCTQAQALNMGLPMSLDKTAEALGLIVGKDREGHKLMLQMCKPRLKQPDGSCLWWDDRDRRQRLGLYCVRDVETERAIGMRVRPMPDRERAIWLLDQEINERGMKLDLSLIESGQMMVAHATQKLDEDVRKLTDGMVQNPRKRKALLAWLHRHSELTDVDSIDKHAVAELLRRNDLDGAVRAVLTIRQESAKSSTAKLTVMRRAVCSDGRIRGLLQYYGARQTGRWAGRLLQPHNFPKGHIKWDELEQIVLDVIRGATDKSFDVVSILHGPPLDVMSSLLRSCIVAKPGHIFQVVDFAAIEARVLAWLAQQRDLLRLFASGGDPYRVMAAKVYRKYLINVTSEERWLGKQLILGCGFQQGADSFMLRLEKEGLEVTQDFAEEAIKGYREANPAITELWFQMGQAAMEAIRHPGTVYRNKVLAFFVHRGILFMKLPSGRYLAYLRPSVRSVTTMRHGSPWTRDQIFFWGVDPVTYQWTELYSYGGKLTENAVQAIARDLLADAMLRAKSAGLGNIVLHVHDEFVVETPIDGADLDKLIALASEVPSYLEGCPIAVAGWQGPRYRK